MTLEQRAEALASKANECCYRSDGYEDDMKATILTHLRAVVEACAEVADRAEKDGEGMSPDYFLACSLVAERIRQEVGE